MGVLWILTLQTKKTVYVTMLQILNRRAKEKDFVQSFFAKSPTVYNDLKKLHAKTAHGSFVKLNISLTAAKKWQPSFDKSLSQIIKKCKICTYHSDIIDTDDVVQLETIKSADESPGHILMTDLFSGFALGTTSSSTDPHNVIDTFFSLWVVGQHGDGFGMPSNYVNTNSGHMLDTKEGKDFCKELELTWKYPQQQKVILLAPDCQHILQDIKALKVISPGDGIFFFMFPIEKKLFKLM